MKKLEYLILICLLSSCLQSGVKRVRIVDAQGNPAKINKIVPQFNREQMDKQKEAFNSTKTSGNNSNVKFVNANNNIIQQIDDPNFVTVSNDLPNDDVFADRITNFNYTENGQKQQPDNKKTFVVNGGDKNIITSNNTKNGNTIANVYDSTNKDTSKNNLAVKNSVQEVLVQNNKNIVANNSNKLSKTPKAYTVGGKKYYIQIGVFGEKSNAEASYSKYSKISNGVIDNYTSKGKIKYKVALGPYTDKNIAEKDLEKVIKMGHYDVYITEKK